MVPHAGVKDGTNSQKAAHGAVTRTARVRRQQDSNLQSAMWGVRNGHTRSRPTCCGTIFHSRDIYSGMSRDATDTHNISAGMRPSTKTKETHMANIKIGRYAHPSISDEWSGWGEPEDRSWIIWLNADGKPALYYPERDSGGGVIGEGYRIDA